LTAPGIVKTTLLTSVTHIPSYLFIHYRPQTVESSPEYYRCWSLRTFLAKLNNTDLYTHNNTFKKHFTFPLHRKFFFYYYY